MHNSLDLTELDLPLHRACTGEEGRCELRGQLVFPQREGEASPSHQVSPPVPSPLQQPRPAALVSRGTGPVITVRPVSCPLTPRLLNRGFVHVPYVPVSLGTTSPQDCRFIRRL